MKHLEKPMEFDGNLSIPNTFIIVITSWIVRAPAPFHRAMLRLFYLA